MELSDLKEKLAIDSSIYDSQLNLYLKSAESLIKGAIGTEKDDFYDNNELFETATLMLVDHFFSNKSATTTKSIHETPIGVKTIILQMKPAYALFKSEGDNNAIS